MGCFSSLVFMDFSLGFRRGCRSLVGSLLWWGGVVIGRLCWFLCVDRCN